MILTVSRDCILHKKSEVLAIFRQIKFLGENQPTKSKQLQSDGGGSTFLKN
jgi:hypothetical protein